MKKNAIDLCETVFDSENLYRIYTEIYDIESFKKEIDLFDISIYSGEHQKIERCIKENVDYIIDDSEEVCFQASKQHIHVIYFKKMLPLNY